MEEIPLLVFTERVRSWQLKTKYWHLIKREADMLKAILFDFHGTLAYPRKQRDIKRFLQGIRERGYEVYTQEFEAARKFVFFIDYPKFGFDSYESFLEKVFERLGIRISKRDLIHFSSQYKEESEFLLHSDVRRTLKKLHAKYKIGILTTIPLFIIEEGIGSVRQFVDVITTGFDAGVPKPNPKIYMKALERLKVNAKEAVMVGDEYDYDIEIPKALGMRTVFIDREGKQGCKEADASITSLDELESAIARFY